MKTGKYFLGGAIKGVGGKAVKFFMKQPFVRKKIADKIIEINNVYAKSSKPKYVPASKTFKSALKKLDVKEAKAYVTGREMGDKIKAGYDILKRSVKVKMGPKDTKLRRDLQDVRDINARLIKGVRQLRSYRKDLGKKAKALMEKEVSGKKPN
tara:strand:+ start:186 stop:644 length:459 start_codon:yes stop_codon:yes gene_type:complete